jgi:hypothetical protein
MSKTPIFSLISVFFLALLSPALVAAQTVGVFSSQTAVAGPQIGIGGMQGPPLTPPPGSTPPEQKCVLQGRVTNSMSGEPVKKASVHLRFLNQVSSGAGMIGGGAQGYTATSDADGSFKFEGIEPGEYSLAGDRTGFLNTQYGAKGPMQAGTNLSLRPSQHMADLNLQLIPQAVISGKVVDDDGDPVGNAMVQVLAQMWQRGKLRYMPRGGSQTDDRGEYRISNLSPGKYFLFVQKFEMAMPGNDVSPPGKPDIRPVRTFFPDAINMESAAPVEVRAGQDSPGMDIHLRRTQTYHVRGKIVGDIPGDPERIMLNVMPHDQNMMMMFNSRSNVNKDRTFDLAGIAPGSYSLNVLTMANGPGQMAAHVPIEVGAGDVNDIVINVVPGGTIRGQVKVEGNVPANAAQPNLARAHVFLNSTEGTFFMRMDQGGVKQDGTFALENVGAGKYYLNVSGGPDGSYLKSVRLNHQDVLGKELDLSQGAAGEIEVVFRYGAAEVDGTLQAAQNAPDAGSSGAAKPSSPLRASILLVPDVLNADGSGVRTTGADQNGSFSLKQVPPGHYRAYAVEQMNMGQLQNPDLLKQLESKGTEVEVKENDKKQVQLSVTSADELQQIFAHLGLDSSQ